MFKCFSDMESWKKVSYTVCVFMFLSHTCPLNPYITAYLTGPNGNISLSEVSNAMESIKSYSALTATAVTFVTADYLLYKPNIVIIAAWSCISYLLLTSAPGLARLKVSNIGAGASYCLRTLTMSYMYAKIDDKRHYQMITGIVNIGALLGKLAGDVWAQIVVSTSGGNYTALPYCNAFTLFLATVWAISFAPVKREHNRLETSEANEKSKLLERGTKYYTEENVANNHNDREQGGMAIFLKKLWTNFKISYSNAFVLKKSIWYTMAMGSFLQVVPNTNILYSYVVNKQGNHDVFSNGFVEAMATLCGAAGSYAIGKVQLDWTVYGDVFTGFCSVIMGVLMMSCYFYDRLIFIYLAYTLYTGVFNVAIVVTYSEIAKRLRKQCYSLVLQLNFFGALLTVAVMTLFFIQFNFLGITVPGRFLFIGGLYSVLGVLFLFTSSFERSKRMERQTAVRTVCK